MQAIQISPFGGIHCMFDRCSHADYKKKCRGHFFTWCFWGHNMKEAHSVQNVWLWCVSSKCDLLPIGSACRFLVYEGNCQSQSLWLLFCLFHVLLLLFHHSFSHNTPRPPHIELFLPDHSFLISINRLVPPSFTGSAYHVCTHMLLPVL